MLCYGGGKKSHNEQKKKTTNNFINMQKGNDKMFTLRKACETIKFISSICKK